MHARHQSRGGRCCAHTKGACSQPGAAVRLKHGGGATAQHVGGGGQCATHGAGAQAAAGVVYVEHSGTTTGSVRVGGGGALRRRISSSDVQWGINSFCLCEAYTLVLRCLEKKRTCSNYSVKTRAKQFSAAA